MNNDVIGCPIFRKITVVKEERGGGGMMIESTTIRWLRNDQKSKPKKVDTPIHCHVLFHGEDNP